MSVCVGSNPTPVKQRFEHDEAEPSADKFCHTGMLIEDNSPKQKKPKNGNIIGGRQPSGFQVHKKEDNQPIHVNHESTRGFERKSFHMDDTNRLAD